MGEAESLIAAAPRTGRDVLSLANLALVGQSGVNGLGRGRMSVVGTGRLLQSGYFRAKSAQEKLIKDSSVPSRSSRPRSSSSS